MVVGREYRGAPGGDGLVRVNSRPGSSAPVAGPARTADIRHLMSQIHAMARSTADVREAVVVARECGVAVAATREALKACQLAEEEQFQISQEAAEVHLRTQRQAGGLLNAMEMHHGGRPKTDSSVASVSEHAPPTLRDLGLDAHESHRWQRIAGLSTEDFEGYIRESRAKRRELTTAAVLAVASQRARDERVAREGRRPSSKPMLLAKYERTQQQVAELIWLDPLALASAIGPARRFRVLDELARLRFWMDEVEAALT
jgi:hypothetical protein